MSAAETFDSQALLEAVDELGEALAALEAYDRNARANSSARAAVREKARTGRLTLTAPGLTHAVLDTTPTPTEEWEARAISAIPKPAPAVTETPEEEPS